MKHPAWYLAALAALAATVVASFCACVPSPVPNLVPVPPQEPTEIQWTAVLPERIAQADGVAVATIAKMEADWTYDDPCGILTIIMHGCIGTVTYRVHLQPVDKYVWVFTPAYGSFGLFEGERAVFVWHKIAAYRYKQCKEQQGMTSADCMADVIPALTDDLDVLPLADSARVATLRARP